MSCGVLTTFFVVRNIWVSSSVRWRCSMADKSIRFTPPQKLKWKVAFVHGAKAIDWFEAGFLLYRSFGRYWFNVYLWVGFFLQSVFLQCLAVKLLVFTWPLNWKTVEKACEMKKITCRCLRIDTIRTFDLSTVFLLQNHPNSFNKTLKVEMKPTIYHSFIISVRVLCFSVVDSW